MHIKNRIIDVLNSYDDGKYSNIVLNDYFKSNRLNRKEKSFITEVFYGVIRNEIYIDFLISEKADKIKKRWIKNLLKLSVYQLLYMDSDAAGVIWEAVEITKSKFGVNVSKFINGVLRAIDREQETIKNKLIEDGKEEIYYSYPKWFYKRIKKQFGDKYQDVLKSFKSVPYLSIRVNNINYSMEKLKNLLNEKNIKIIKEFKDVLYINSGEIIDSEEFKNGQIIVQDGSSYLAAYVLDPKKGDNVLDSCSAPGGKSLAMASIMENVGSILALDIHEHKIKLIDDNAKKMDVTIIKSEKIDAREIDEFYDNSFDKVLVDAPCSGLGVIRKKPETLYNKDYDKLKELSKLQLEILESSAKTLKIGGELVYSTCTIFKEENGDVIKKFLENNNNFEIIQLEKPKEVDGYFDELGGLNILDQYFDGFYIIKLKRIS